MKKIILSLYLVLALASLFACIKNGGEVIKKQDAFSATEWSGPETELPVPGVVIDGYRITDVKITSDGNELYLGASNSKYYTILVSKRIDGRWTAPEIVKSIENPEYNSIMTLFNPNKHII